MATKTRMTVEAYYAVTVEGDRMQLVEGELVVNEPRPIHGILQVRLSAALFNWSSAGEGRGLVMFPTDVVLDDFNVFGPDIVYVAERNRPADLHQRLARVPDLCVEIRSPGTWRYDVGAKKAAYERGGLPELWLVDDRSETLLAFRRSSPDGDAFDVALELTPGDVLTSPQLPGFALAMDDLFAPA
ncbi:hypothetical protein BH20ACT18_BH20ACT18_05230 [soil metagenome]